MWAESVREEIGEMFSALDNCANSDQLLESGGFHVYTRPVVRGKTSEGWCAFRTKYDGYRKPRNKEKRNEWQRLRRKLDPQFRQKDIVRKREARARAKAAQQLTITDGGGR